MRKLFGIRPGLSFRAAIIIWQHEPCWYAVRSGSTGHWQGSRQQSTIWAINHRKSETGHSTQKPVECMRRPIENNSSPGQAVYDPFVGSGTTIIAAEMTGRACHAIGLKPAYIDVAVTRWQIHRPGGNPCRHQTQLRRLGSRARGDHFGLRKCVKTKTAKIVAVNHTRQLTRTVITSC